MIKDSIQSCPLCKYNKSSHYFQDKTRDYYQCDNCNLVFVPEKYHLSSQEEKSIYDLHQNDAQDPGYQKFISRLTKPLLTKIKKEAKGLDFGSGSSSSIPILLQDKTSQINLYDKFYANKPEALNQKYDFITCTEVFEHLSKPEKVLKQLLLCLKRPGILAIMTKRVIGPEAFSTWHYKNDPTHIIFFSEGTFRWITKTYSLRLEIIDKDVIFLYQ